MKHKNSESRGYFQNEWLKSFHSFSFGDYYDPDNLHFRDLRVINHDFIAADSGFGTHPHRDMEIMTYILNGEVQHKDSMGNKTSIRVGEVQIMSAGTGITHSEFNPDPKTELELLQIWILPKGKGLTPYYEQRKFTDTEKKNRLCLLASNDKKENSLLIHQDIKIYGSLLEQDHQLEFKIPSGKFAWLQLANGELEVNGQLLKKGDAVYSETQDQIFKIKGVSNISDFILFELI